MWACAWGPNPRPAVDCFADSFSAKASTFYSAHWCPGTAALDGLQQSWRPQPGKPAILFIFPPPHLAAKAVAKVLREQPTCVLVLPAWPTWWQAALSQAPIRARWTLPVNSCRMTPGPQVPEHARKAELRRRYPFEVSVLWW